MKKSKQKAPIPILRFRVYPSTLEFTSSLYFVVYVWATKKDLLYTRRKVKKLKGSCYAYVSSFDSFKLCNNNWKRQPIVGEIHFYKAQTGMGIISHECLHATISFLQREKYNFSKLGEANFKSAHEEVFAEILGEMTRFIGNRLWDAKSYRQE